MVNFFTMESALTGMYFVSCYIVNIHVHSIKTKFLQGNHEILKPFIDFDINLISYHNLVIKT